MSWPSSPRLFRKRIFRVNLELKRGDKPYVLYTGKRAPGDPYKGKWNRGRVVKRLERVRMGPVLLDFENGKKWGASEILF